MKKLVTAALIGAAFTLAACGDSYDEEDNAEASDEAAAGTTYTEPAPTDEAPAPTDTATPEPEPAEPEPAEPDDY